jgi:hypothetical protein
MLVEREPTHDPHLPMDHFHVCVALANDQGDRAIGIVLSVRVRM